MNCSHNCKMCRVCRYVRKHFKNFIIKSILCLNLFSFFYWVLLIDYIISWQPFAIMAVNLLVVFLIGYANKDMEGDFL